MHVNNRLLLVLGIVIVSFGARAQTAPSQVEIDAYRGIHRAAAEGNVDQVGKIARSGANLNVRDGHGRTPLMIAIYNGSAEIAEVLIEEGADINALDSQQYDVLTIAAVIDDLPLLDLALRSGADPAAVTSPYEGTALIAAAHLGHVEVVQSLIEAGAPVDHINNLKWTALIEAIVLGDGGPSYQQIVKSLVKAGANVNLADGNGFTPLHLASVHGYQVIAQLLLQAGALP